MSDTNAQATAGEARKAEGIGGWMILPVIIVVVWTIAYAYFAVEQFSAPQNALPVVVGNFGLIGILSTAFSLLTVFMVAVGIYCLVRLFQKSKRTPTAITAFFLLNVLWAALNVVALLAFFGNDHSERLLEAARGFGQSILPAAIWIWYFRVSTRVKNTFVR